LLFMALPSCCPFPRRSAVPGRSVIQAYAAITPEGFCNFSGPFGAEALCSLKPCDSISERTIAVSSIYWTPGNKSLRFRLRLS
jgi:hypothetical protein